MDSHANNHNHIDMDLLHDFNLLVQDDHPPLFRDDKLESHLKQDQNLNSELGFQDFGPIEDLSFWDCCDFPMLSFNDDISECHGEANCTTGAAATNHLWFQDFDPYKDSSLWESYWDDGLPLLSTYNDHESSESSGEVKCSSGANTAAHGGLKVAKRSTVPLEFEDIEKHFELPITMAAKELNIGLTRLKKRCRELNIKRWPHRKLKSLQSLIQNVKEMGLEEEREMLEGQKMMMEKLPEMELTERTKKLRQACFKANYKKRRLDYSTDYPFSF